MKSKIIFAKCDTNGTPIRPNNIKRPSHDGEGHISLSICSCVLSLVCLLLEFKPQIVRDQRDKLRIGGFTL